MLTVGGVGGNLLKVSFQESDDSPSFVFPPHWLVPKVKPLLGLPSDPTRSFSSFYFLGSWVLAFTFSWHMCLLRQWKPSRRRQWSSTSWGVVYVSPVWVLQSSLLRLRCYTLWEWSFLSRTTILVPTYDVRILCQVVEHPLFFFFLSPKHSYPFRPRFSIFAVGVWTHLLKIFRKVIKSYIKIIITWKTSSGWEKT